MMKENQVTLEEKVEEAVRRTNLYLITEGYGGFASEDNKENRFEVHDIQGLFVNLENEEILPMHRLQYTVDSNEGSYYDMDTQFIVFGYEDIDGGSLQYLTVKALIPFQEVLREEDGFQAGLTEEGFRKLATAIFEV